MSSNNDIIIFFLRNEDFLTCSGKSNKEQYKVQRIILTRQAKHTIQKKGINYFLCSLKYVFHLNKNY